eukprot:1849138-Pyramimonas_sp.AAC.1
MTRRTNRPNRPPPRPRRRTPPPQGRGGPLPAGPLPATRCADGYTVKLAVKTLSSQFSRQFSTDT